MCLELHAGIFEGLDTFRFSRNKERAGVVKGSEFCYIAVQCRRCCDCGGLSERVSGHLGISLLFLFCLLGRSEKITDPLVMTSPEGLQSARCDSGGGLCGYVTVQMNRITTATKIGRSSSYSAVESLIADILWYALNVIAETIGS